jgi:hypothetical protein
MMKNGLAHEIPDNPPNDEEAPFEPKASDWGWFKGRLLALDYAAPALFEDALAEPLSATVDT